MPYIIPERRKSLETVFWPETSGELNYLLTKTIKVYLNRYGTNYKTMNEIVGALECAKLEFYRRIATPYEDDKIKQNGDVY